MFSKFKLGNRVSIVIYDAGEIEGNILMISEDKKDIILDNIKYISSCYSKQEWREEPVIHITEQEVHEIQLIA